VGLDGPQRPSIAAPAHAVVEPWTRLLSKARASFESRLRPRVVSLTKNPRDTGSLLPRRLLLDSLDTLNVYQRYFVEEFADDYKEQRLSRREMLRKVLYVTGSVPLTASVLLALGCGDSSNDKAPAGVSTAPTTAPAATQPVAAATALPGTPPAATGAGVTVQPTDPAIGVRDVSFKGKAGDVFAYLAKPKAAGGYAAVIVIHENRGLVEHIKDVARRYAKENFVALAVDLVSRAGGTQANEAQNTGALGRANPDDLVQDLLSGVDYLKQQPFVKAGALGVTGFCFGGGFTWELAVASPEIKAAVPYYGTTQRIIDKLGQTNAAILAMYGSLDRSITPQAAATEEKLKAANKTYQIKIYDGANHAFFNDTGGAYNADAARDAWQLTLGWFRKYLTG
jgi:carboxymethylenebutenolidase